jgi:lipid-A-disaccharide synthase-like uncharacterized protein
MSATAWTALGILAQACFFMRFLVQWLESEKKKESVIPVSFWYWSLLGSSGLLVYAVHVRDPVFILGQSTGFFIYIRNLVMIRRRRESSDS